MVEVFIGQIERRRVPEAIPGALLLMSCHSDLPGNPARRSDVHQQCEDRSNSDVVDVDGRLIVFRHEVAA